MDLGPQPLPTLANPVALPLFMMGETTAVGRLERTRPSPNLIMPSVNPMKGLLRAVQNWRGIHTNREGIVICLVIVSWVEVLVSGKIVYGSDPIGFRVGAVSDGYTGPMGNWESALIICW